MIRTLITLFLIILSFLAGFWTRGFVEINKQKFEEEKTKLKNIVGSVKEKSNEIKENVEKTEDKKDEIGKIMNQKVKNKK